MYREVTSIDEQIESKLSLVNMVVGQMNLKVTKMLDFDDYISVGVMGLYDAFLKYDASSKASFDTYAKFRIRGAIIDEMRRVGELSRTRMSKLNELYKVVNELQNKLFREPTDLEICAQLEISVAELGELYQSMHFLSKDSLDATFQSNGSNAYEDFRTPHEYLEEKERYEELAEKLKRLDDRSQLILNLIYVEELSLKEIAEILSISVSRVSQLHGKALMKTRQMF